MKAPPEVLLQFLLYGSQYVMTRCNHCGINAKFMLQETEEFTESDETVWNVRGGYCDSCGRPNLWLVNRPPKRNSFFFPAPTHGYLIYPRRAYYPEAPPEMPKELVADYTEAVEVLDISPKASAALSRRCLQYLLSAQGFTQKDLSKQIQAVLDSQRLPSDLANAIEFVRVVGNFATHPIKSTSTGKIVDVEPGEAEWNLEVLASLFDFFYVRPGVLKEKRARLNEKLSDTGKPPLKGTNDESVDGDN